MASIKNRIFFVLFGFIILASMGNVFGYFNSLFVPEELYYSLAAGLFLSVIMMMLCFNRSLTKFELTRTDLFILMFCTLVVVLSILNHSNQVVTRSRCIESILLVLIYFTSKQYFSNDNAKTTVVGIVFLFLSLACISGIIGFLEYFQVISPDDTTDNLSGGFANSASFINYLSLLFVFIVSLCLTNKEVFKNFRRISVIICLSLFILIVLSKSRTAWVSCLTGLIYIFLTRERLILKFRTVFNKPLKQAGVLLTLVAFTIIAFYSLYHFKKDSADGRILIWRISVNAIYDKPLTGQGFNSFSKTYNTYQANYFKTHPKDETNGLLADDASYAFNDFLLVLFETGIVGLVVFLAILVSLFTGNKAKQNTGDPMLMKASRASLIALFVCALFSYPFCSIQNLLIFVFLAAYMSASAAPTLTFKLKKINTIRIFITLVILLILVSIEYHQIRLIRSSFLWKKAYLLAEDKKTKEAFELYKQVYPVLKDNSFYFLFNYGTMLAEINKYKESIYILESAKKLNTNFDLYINLGSSYEELKEYAKAEASYQMAMNIIPNRFIPKYCLFQLYKKTNQPKKSYDMAAELYTMKIKVFSPLVGSIKDEARLYLREHSH